MRYGWPLPHSRVPVEAPVGAVLPYAGPINATTQAILQAGGWLFCDGSLVSAWDYPELFATIGALYGTTQARNTGGKSETLFYIPDYRGVFLRGLTRDATRGAPQTGMARDPDAASRTGARYDTTSNQYQGNTGNAVGSTQADAYLTHEHTYQEAASPVVPPPPPLGLFAQPQDGDEPMGLQSATTTDETYTGSGTPPDPISTTETRPLNTAVNFIIKAQPRVLPNPAAHSFSTCLQDCWGQQGGQSCASCPAAQGPSSDTASSQ